MIWIQCDSAGVVTRVGPTRRSAKPDTTDYQIDALPPHLPGDVITYDGAAFRVDSTARIAAARAELEPQMLTAHARWQSAVTLGLSCAADCQAKYEALRAEYDAL